MTLNQDTGKRAQRVLLPTQPQRPTDQPVKKMYEWETRCYTTSWTAASVCRQSGLDPQRTTGDAFIIDAASTRRQSGLDPQRKTGNVFIIGAALDRRQSGLNPQGTNGKVLMGIAALDRRQSGLNPQGESGNVVMTDAASSRRRSGTNHQRLARGTIIFAVSFCRQIEMECRGRTGPRATEERLKHAVAFTDAASPCRHWESHRRRRTSANTRAIDDESHLGVGVMGFGVKSWCESGEEILRRPDRLQPHGKDWIPTPLHASDDDLTSGDCFDPF